MKKVLITGGAGFIGSSLSRSLLERNFDVTVLDNLSEQIHGTDPLNTSPLYQSIRDKVRFINGSIASRQELTSALEGQEIVVHFAAETGTGQSMYNIHKYCDVNIGGTALLLDILTNTKHRVERFIVASSRSIYGEGKYFSPDLNTFVYPKHREATDMSRGDFEVKYPNCKKPLVLVATDEESKIHPSSVYGITKQNQEQMVMTVCPTIGIEPVAFRYQNVYGPGQSLTNPYTGILSIFSGLIKNGKTINIFEDGKESRDFVYIDDVVDATFLGITRPEASGEVFNVGTGVGVSVLTVARTLIENYGSEVDVRVSGNFRVGDIRHNVADLTKIEKRLQFKPRFTFHEGIKRFTQWVNQQNIVGDGYEKSLSEMKAKGLFK